MVINKRELTRMMIHEVTIIVLAILHKQKYIHPNFAKKLTVTTRDTLKKHTYHLDSNQRKTEIDTVIINVESKRHK